jgi:hypothetical protein
VEWSITDGNRPQLRDSACMRWSNVGKRIVKCSSYPLLNFGFAEQWNCVADAKGKKPKIIQTMDMVGVFVREHDGIDHSDFLTDQLVSQVRRGIDQEIAAW